MFLMMVSMAAGQTATNTLLANVEGTLAHMTTAQKVEYAKQLRNAGALGAAIDTLIEAVQDIANKEAKSAAVSNVCGVVEVSTNVFTGHVEQLIKDGNVCAVVGHQWTRIPHVTLEYRPDGNYPLHRKCAICGLEQTQTVTQTVGEWK